MVKIKIVESYEAYNEEVFRKLQQDAIHKPLTGLVMTPYIFSKMFTPERIKLLQFIHKKNITSIYDLAKKMEKPYEVVFRNIQYLAAWKLIRIKEKDHRKIPYIPGKFSVDFFGEI